MQKVSCMRGHFNKNNFPFRVLVMNAIVPQNSCVYVVEHP